MGITEHETQFLGHSIHQYDPDAGLDPAAIIQRVGMDYDDDTTTADLLRALVGEAASNKLEGIVIGPFDYEGGDSGEIIDILVESAPKLPALRGIFIGDIVSEENEISWINHGPVGGIFEVYPNLEVFRIRGSNGLSLGRLNHAKLRGLVIESGGLPSEIVVDLFESNLPALTALELWLGDENYGWDGTLDLFEPLFEGNLFPNLRHLGLRDAEIADEIAIAIAEAPIMDRLTSLDLSLGVLSDHGAEALLKSPKFRKLDSFNYRHHYVTRPMMQKLRALSIEIDDSEAEDPDGDGDEDDRYIAVSE